MKADVDQQEIRDAELLANLRVQTDEALEGLPEAERAALKALRTEYATYAEVNAHHLEGNRRRLRKAVRVVVIGGVLLATVLIVLGLFSLSNTAAVCSFRDNLQHEVDASNDFLDHHPEGFAGVPAATIRNSIRNQQSTLDALSRSNTPLVPPLQC